MVHIVDLVQSQVIASVKEEADIDKAINSKANIVFLLTGNLINMKDYVDRLRKANKQIFIHIDFIEGISNTKSAIQFIAYTWKPTGIITTKSSLIKYAKEVKLMTIQRIFLIDGAAISKGIEMSLSCKPDAIEVLPGLMPTIIDRLTRAVNIPVIAGGLISSKQDILQGLEVGALAISSGNPALWNFDL
ncbi:glycerol-3-phosphate responsive antiterminator [Neobacillus notoginsengisoli]|uniref:Glycerol uptake operon antiterminator regulatory protein n=1 Tax=Neobacillus notoginsengisoli TaxID=1578198 RepID=A0A417YET7_9BACI|nr:glycerol-3-phosphate responsive antiterminator [Neobacillus notoginsengisoli]RHW31173.1 glycerol-3-phosphate responsive antiterminator [Neobacillus notoginsengisoli]